METTFITIHDLTPEATILFSSDSVVDILGYSPDQVVNHSCWEFFHPEEIPIARVKYGKSVELDKAAVLSYCSLRHADGGWVGCEVVFTISYDIMVGCISVYSSGLKSKKRAEGAPTVRRLFSSSPRDPRYHMLSHLSSKFQSPTKPELHEPRAALFLNRYTRTLTIMYATDGLADLLGVSGEDMRGRSFYYCIQEHCLQDAVRCLENAKENDSIAYLRFWYRDLREDDHYELVSGAYIDRHDQETRGDGAQYEDSEMTDLTGNTTPRDILDNVRTAQQEPADNTAFRQPSYDHREKRAQDDGYLQPPHSQSRTSSGESNPHTTREAIFGEAPAHESSESSPYNSPSGVPRQGNGHQPIELEAVISCASDGLVVCLRQARPVKPEVDGTRPNGTYAVPWAAEPMLPPIRQRARYTSVTETGFAPSVTPVQRPPPHAAHYPPERDFMDAIREIAVFAWALIGINGSLADYSHGNPSGEAQPPDGLPIWQPDAQKNAYRAERTNNISNYTTRTDSLNINGANGVNRVGVPIYHLNSVEAFSKNSTYKQPSSRNKVIEASRVGSTAPGNNGSHRGWSNPQTQTSYDATSRDPDTEDGRHKSLLQTQHR